jgi:sortase A
VLSLADNPLIVEEESASPIPTDTPVPVGTPTESSSITRIVAPTINLDAPIISVGWTTITREDGTPVNIWTVADYAAGWHKNSALPAQGGNIVLSGHHNIKGEVFRYTIDLNVGDIVTVYEGDQPYNYAVVDKFIVKDKGEPEAVRRENAKWIGPFNEERLTLVTCWPYNNNTHRAIVIAKPVQPQ